MNLSRLPWLLICGASLLSGCAHKQLSRNTALTATTVNTIQYQMVVDNLAAMSCTPGTMPAHIRLETGTVQISNRLGWGESGGFNLWDNMRFGMETFGPNAQTTLSEQWGTDAVEDPIRVWELQVLYHRVLGLPLPQKPNFISHAMRAEEMLNANDDNGNDREELDNDVQELDDDPTEIEEVGAGLPVLPPPTAAKAIGGPTPLPSITTSTAQQAVVSPVPQHPESNRGSTRNSSPNGQRNRANNNKNNKEGLEPLPVEEYDLPVGWFGIGSKRDVPKNARYVGRYKERYVWVPPEGMEGLSQFTLAVLTVVKLDPGKERPGSGMMFTP